MPISPISGVFEPLYVQDQKIVHTNQNNFLILDIF